jgi:hypothetical protein
MEPEVPPQEDPPEDDILDETWFNDDDDAVTTSTTTHYTGRLGLLLCFSLYFANFVLNLNVNLNFI